MTASAEADFLCETTWKLPKIINLKEKFGYLKYSLFFNFN